MGEFPGLLQRRPGGGHRTLERVAEFGYPNEFGGLVGSAKREGGKGFGEIWRRPTAISTPGFFQGRDDDRRLGHRGRESRIRGGPRVGGKNREVAGDV